MTMNKISSAKRISTLHGEKLLLLALANAIDDRETCCPSIATLASQCSVSTRTAQRLIRGLVATDLIERHLQQRSDGSRTSNHYRLLPGEDRDLSDCRDANVVAIRQGWQVPSEAGDMAAEFRHRPIAPHSGANSWQPEQLVGERIDESTRAAESPVPFFDRRSDPSCIAASQAFVPGTRTRNRLRPMRTTALSGLQIA